MTTNTVAMTTATTAMTTDTTAMTTPPPLQRPAANRLRSVASLIALLGALLLQSCSDYFDVHPYDVKIDGQKHINGTNIMRIKAMWNHRDTLRIALISDTHLWLSDARDAVSDINRRPDINFVIHLGDLTDTGTIKEFKWTRDILNNLLRPYVALIGNHDFLGTGDETYTHIYGPMDFSFVVGRVKFVCLNTNATEYDYMAAVPNFDYMEQEFTRDTLHFDRAVVLMHAPPYSDQFNNNVCKAFRRYLDICPGLLCCVYGHNHKDKVEAIYDDDLLFYGIDCAMHRNYRIMTITPHGYEMEQVYY